MYVYGIVDQTSAKCLFVLEVLLMLGFNRSRIISPGMGILPVYHIKEVCCTYTREVLFNKVEARWPECQWKFKYVSFDTLLFYFDKLLCILMELIR